VTHWTDGRLIGFDLETTAPDPEEARIVTAAVVACGGGLPTEEAFWVVDAGVPVPDGAAEVHGYTTERVRAEGTPVARALPGVLATLEAHLRGGAPLAVFNARYDLTVLDREARRLGEAPLQERADLLVVDPLVIDRWLERYRRGSRKLADQCAHWGARLDGAHDATADALAAARLAWRIGRAGEVVRRVRSADEGRERAALRREWERARHDLRLLHAAQRRWALAERERFAEYKAAAGEREEAARIAAEVGWPVLEPRAERMAT
jgi:DNA polymerase III epsilon subunit-like protein